RRGSADLVRRAVGSAIRHFARGLRGAPDRARCPRQVVAGAPDPPARSALLDGRGSGGHRLAGSYVNFYVANGAVVMPLLDPRTDRQAKASLARLFPKRRVIGVPS